MGMTEVYQILNKTKEPMTAEEISKMVGLTANSVRKNLKNLLERNLVKATKKVYRRSIENPNIPVYAIFWGIVKK